MGESAPSFSLKSLGVIPKVPVPGKVTECRDCQGSCLSINHFSISVPSRRRPSQAAGHLEEEASALGTRIAIHNNSENRSHQSIRASGKDRVFILALLYLFKSESHEGLRIGLPSLHMRVHSLRDRAACSVSCFISYGKGRSRAWCQRLALRSPQTHLNKTIWLLNYGFLHSRMEITPPRCYQAQMK